MGIKNSSETRVKPLGQAILREHDQLKMVLELINASPIGDFEDKNVYFKDEGCGRKEKSLPATPQHLLSILELIQKNSDYRNSIRKKAIRASKKEERALLFELDNDAFIKARKIVSNHTKGNQNLWASFEGESRPDLFIENDKAIVLVEGKRTESDTTGEVLYLENRSQMVRHIENALYYSNYKKKVIAFYIIDGDCNYHNHCTKDALINDVKNETIRKSDEIEKLIIGSFYGYTTWQEIGEHLGIQYK